MNGEPRVMARPTPEVGAGPRQGTASDAGHKFELEHNPEHNLNLSGGLTARQFLRQEMGADPSGSSAPLRLPSDGASVQVPFPTAEGLPGITSPLPPGFRISPNADPGARANAGARGMTDIIDIKPPEPMPSSALQWPLIGAGVVVALVAALAVAWLLGRRRAPVQAPSLSPRDQALVDLEVLGRVLEGGIEPREYYFQLSATFRAYIEGRFNVPAMERTTEELSALLAALDIDEGIKRDARRFISEMDPYKYANVMPEGERMARDLEFARSFVESTRPAPDADASDASGPDAAGPNAMGKGAPARDEAAAPATPSLKATKTGMARGPMTEARTTGNRTVEAPGAGSVDSGVDEERAT